MATDFIMPQMPTASRDHYFPQQQQHFQPAFLPSNFHQSNNYPGASNVYTHAASNFVTPYNPQISPLSTSNNSTPTSPKSQSQYHTRQVRPLYIPAVLRPTEHPSHESAARGSTGNMGSEGAVDNDTDDDESVDGRRPVRSSGSFISLPGLGAFGFGRLSRRATNDSGKCVDSAWNLDLYPEVAAPPSREHWKPDQESTMCDEPTCKKTFNYFTRRHHCRRCGNIFCDFHSAFEIPLDENANYNPRGYHSRGCAYCFREFKAWRSRTNSSDLSSTGSTTPTSSGRSVGPSGSANKPATAPASPVMALTGRPGAHGTPTVAKTPDVAQSVPGDWSWSTF